MNQCMPTPLLDVEHLDISFGSTPAVRDLSFAIAIGESVGLVGESGSGKSVTSLAIGGRLAPQARVGGGTRFAGKDLLGETKARMRKFRGREITMIFKE